MIRTVRLSQTTTWDTALDYPDVTYEQKVNVLQISDCREEK